MPNFLYHKAGVGHVGSYQVSGRPWITGSSMAPSASVTVRFPSVTKSVTIIAGNGTRCGHINDTHTGSLVVFFGQAPPSALWDGSNIPQICAEHYISLLDPEDAITLDIKCKEVHITNLGYGNPSTPSEFQTSGVSGSFKIVAELTSIEAKNMYVLTGSGIDE